MNYVENFQDFVINDEVKKIVESVDSLIVESEAEIISINEEELEQINEFSILVAAGLFFVAFYAGSLLDRHVKIKKAELDLKKKIANETDPNKKNKLRDDFEKLTKGEKALKGQIAATEAKLKKSKDKLTESETEKAKRKVLKYQQQLQWIKAHQDKIDDAKKL